jgi:hypothetical protein
VKTLVSEEKMALGRQFTGGNLICLTRFGIVIAKVFSNPHKGVTEGYQRTFDQPGVGKSCIAKKADVIDLAPEFRHFKVNHDLVVPGIKVIFHRCLHKM